MVPMGVPRMSLEVAPGTGSVRALCSCLILTPALWEGAGCQQKLPLAHVQDLTCGISFLGKWGLGKAPHQTNLCWGIPALPHLCVLSWGSTEFCRDSRTTLCALGAGGEAQALKV